MAEERKSTNPGNFAEDREKAARAGHIGGQHSSGNFAHDRARAVEAGRKGGQASHGGGERKTTENRSETRQSRGEGAGHNPGQEAASHHPGNFADDQEKASAARRKGGHSAH